MPAESVTVADREHALWAQSQCRVALDSQARAAAQPAPARAASAASAAPAAGAATTATWPPPSCEDSIAARVARMPAESVSVADRQNAEAARQECEKALTAPPPAANPASRNQAAMWLIAGALIVAMMLLL